MSIAEDIKVLEESLAIAEWTGKWYDGGCGTVLCDYNGEYGSAHGEVAHPEPTGAACYIAACSPDRIKRLVEALKEAEKRAETLEDLVSKYCSKYDD